MRINWSHPQISPVGANLEALVFGFNHLRKSVVKKGVTVLVATHFMEEAEYCDRVGPVFHGQISPFDAGLEAFVSGSNNLRKSAQSADSSAP